MSSNEQNDGRNPARRAFASEVLEARHVFKQGDGEQSPKFALLPTGELANRVFMVGTVTDPPEETDGGRIRVNFVDFSGEAYVYAGQYEPAAETTLRQLDPPCYLAMVVKPDTFETDEGDVYVSLTAQSAAVVDEDTYLQWFDETAEHTINRIANLQDVESFEDPDYDVYSHYGPDIDEEMQDMLVDTLETYRE